MMAGTLKSKLSLAILKTSEMHGIVGASLSEYKGYAEYKNIWKW